MKCYISQLVLCAVTCTWGGEGAAPYPDNTLVHFQSGPIINTQLLTGGSRSCNTTDISGLWNGGGRQWRGWKENKGEGNDGGGVRSLLSTSCSWSSDRFYGHCPPGRPQPPTPRFQLMALTVWVKGQLDSWSLYTHEERAINRHLDNEHCLLCAFVFFYQLRMSFYLEFGLLSD